MLISHSKKFIFFHIPKNAGSSIEKMLRMDSNYPIERVYNYFIDYIGTQPKINLFSMHITPLELQRIKSKGWCKNYLKFAIVRNTWDWHVSQYHFHKQNNHAIYHVIFKDMSFKQYVEWAVLAENIVSSKSMQKKFISDEAGNVLLDRVLRFEELKHDVADLMSELGINKNLPSYNRSKRKSDYRKYYSEAEKVMIEETFKEDVDYFGFDF